MMITDHNSPSFINQIKVNQATHEGLCYCVSGLRHSDGIFPPGFKATISPFSSDGKQKGQAAKVGIGGGGVFGFHSGQKHGPARAQNHLCASPPPLSIMLSTGACIGKD